MLARGAQWHAALGMLCIRCCWQMRDVQQSMYRLLAGARFTQLRYLPEQPAGMGGAGAAGAAGQHGAPLHRAMQPAARAGSGLPFNFTWIPLSPMYLSRLLIPTPPQLCFFHSWHMPPARVPPRRSTPQQSATFSHLGGWRPAAISMCVSLGASGGLRYLPSCPP